MRNTLRLCFLTAAMLAAAACDTVERAGPQPRPSGVYGMDLDVPQIMRGTVAAETKVRGFPAAGSTLSHSDLVVRGFGLVVGLKGTGSRDIPPDLRAHMLKEMSRRGLGSERTGWGRLTPETMLNSEDTAVVVVEAVVPPGAVAGSRFDVRVYADPRTGTTGLESGRLYTTDLRPGPLNVGGGLSFPIAEANGPIFVNPFAEPGSADRGAANRTVGRILDGGVMTKPVPLKLQLLTPSHTRAKQVEDAINTRFPREPGQSDPTAHGESDELVSITVPPSYQNSADEFVALMQHTTIRQVNPESVAMSVRRWLLANPSAAAAASLRWQALGVRSLPIIRDLYDHPEELPRLGALSAGAKLDDAMAIPQLIDMTESGSFEARIQAVELLTDMRLNPQIDLALRQLLDEEDVEVRLAAYEALVARHDPALGRMLVDDKFVLDVVDSDEPMIYITQAGQPRVVVFGADLELATPLLVRAWSNRLMIKGDTGDPSVEVYYRGEDEDQGTISKVDPSLIELIEYMAHTTTVEDQRPGLGLSYGETVGALHQIWRQGHLKADFKAEQDRILAAIMRQEGQSDVPERPEFSSYEAAEDESELFVPAAAAVEEPG